MPAFPEPEMVKQEDWEFKASLNHIARPGLKKKEKRKNKVKRKKLKEKEEDRKRKRGKRSKK